MTKHLFFIGQPVICINDDFSWAKKTYHSIPLLAWPKMGTRYIIRAYLCGGKKPAVALQGIVNPEVIYADGRKREAGFWEGRFVAAPLPDSINVSSMKNLSLDDLDKIDMEELVR